MKPKPGKEEKDPKSLKYWEPKSPKTKTKYWEIYLLRLQRVSIKDCMDRFGVSHQIVCSAQHYGLSHAIPTLPEEDMLMLIDAIDRQIVHLREQIEKCEAGQPVFNKTAKRKATRSTSMLFPPFTGICSIMKNSGPPSVESMWKSMKTIAYREM